jgi:hypothetical protein
MNLTRIVTPAAVVAAVVLAAVPASAQHRGHGGGSTVGRAVPRGGGGPRVAVGPRVDGRVVGVAPYRFYRPYYAFRPRVSLGFGFWAGYPVAYPYYGYYGYPYGYASPYAYAYPPAYGYPAPYGYGYATPSYGYGAPSYGYGAPSYGGDPSSYPSSYPSQPAPNSSVGVQPGTTSGGVSFEITPATAAVFVDGTYVGIVEQFGPTSQPLGLVPGRHHIEVRAQGYRSMVFDVEVTVGQVIPYRGTLQPVQPY